MEPSDPSVTLEEAASQVAFFGQGSTRGCCLVECGRTDLIPTFLAQLGAALGREVARVTLPRHIPPRQLVRWIGDQVVSMPEGAIVVVDGWEAAWPPGPSLDEFFSAANYLREGLLGRPLVYVWWMSPDTRSTFRSKAPDAYSWFTLIVRVEVPYEGSGSAPLAEFATPGRPATDPYTARQTAAWLEGRARARLEEGDTVGGIQLLAEAGTTLGDAGLVVEADDLRKRAEHLLEADSLLDVLLDARGSVEDFDWARALRQMGNWFIAISHRMFTRWLHEATRAYTSALDVFSLHRSPADWAMTQNNLGTTLQALGEMTGREADLRASVKAYENALQVRTKEALPADWAMTQNNLGATLRVLGEMTGSETDLRASVKAYENALQVRTKETLPANWAATQNNLGITLQVLGEMTGSEADLRASVNAFENALQVRTKEALPADWAATQNNLGNTLQALGEMTGREADLRASVKAYENALQVYTKEALPADWVMTRFNLALAQRALGEVEAARANLREVRDSGVLPGSHAYMKAVLQVLEELGE